MKQGGREQRAGPLRSRLEEEPDGVSCGASGAAPRDGTARLVSSSVRRERRSISLDGVRTRPAASPKRDGRTRWSDDDNIMLMRVHFVARELERNTDFTYRNILTQTWNDIRPDRQLYASLLANRVRWLLEEEKCTQIELENIRMSCHPRGAVPGSDGEPPVENVSLRPEEQKKTSKLEEKLIRNFVRFSGVAAESRLAVPRLKGSRKMLEKVEAVNTILLKLIQPADTLQVMVDYVYAAAITVCGEMGVEIRGPRVPKKDQTPPWKGRLETKIQEIRKKIGVLQAYLSNSQPSTRVSKLARRIVSHFGIRTGSAQLRDQMSAVSEKLKQKIKILGNRVKRYNERVMRYKNNKLFHQNQQKFFRSLEEKPLERGKAPTKEAMHLYWKGVWESEKQYDEQTAWIREAEKDTVKYTRECLEITELDMKSVLQKTNNWSAPGVDGVQNYWWKYFTSTHRHLAKLFQEALHNPNIIPRFFTLGKTVMIPKGKSTTDPKNYRPITCLPTVYKILTGVLTRQLWKHINKNKILAPEQGGCRGNSRGCEEILTTDYVITKQAKKKQRNISVAWVDYKKAFDSVPHPWLIKVLRLYGVPEEMIKLLECLMKSWRTNLTFESENQQLKTDTINIRRGIFQGDTLSPLWFCLAMNFLSQLIKKQKYGYILEKERNVKISHQMYIDDLKLYAANEEEMKRLLKIVTAFTKTIGMEIGTDKCAVVHVKRGKIQQGDGLMVMEDITIPRLGSHEHYKYLGVQQALDIKTTEMKNIFRGRMEDEDYRT
ncbi:uncharacterized protein LOC123311647 [Coccinella septempunctata]|uniref:uncharacterized protein LOC123311647 n=1 Tax=Coccinella septempunctata TaxID=41139 RepID=UPI001D06D104|nr:uncharacterized protein LOC123311647 [Coccinella septempunctata]